MGFEMEHNTTPTDRPSRHHRPCATRTRQLWTFTIELLPEPSSVTIPQPRRTNGHRIISQRVSSNNF
jgi:hypothetical protein